MSELPDGWIDCVVGDVIDELKNGYVCQQSKEQNDYPITRIETISKGIVDPLRLGYAEIVDRNLENFRLRNGDILFSHINSPIHLGKTAIYRGIPEVLYHGMNLLRLRTVPDVTSQFLEYQFRFLRTEGVFVLNAQHAVNQASINQKKLSQLPFILPPFNEQKRIADKLDTLLARVDASRERLNRLPAIIKRFRQAVLAAATSGELTAEWREKFSLPEWSFERAAEVCAKVQIGGTPREGFISTPGIPFLKVYNIVEQKVDFDYRPQYVEKNLHNSVLSKSKTKPGDVLMNIVGPPLGKVAIVPDTFSDWNINQAITLFRPSDRVTTEWLYYFLCSGISIAEIVHETRGSAGQTNITLSQCRDFIIPVPPKEEMREIVRRVELLFAFADRLETRVNAARAAADRITPALLAKAFRGELVPQDPSDEPADILLERIRTARSTDNARPRKERTKSGQLILD